MLKFFFAPRVRFFLSIARPLRTKYQHLHLTYPRRVRAFAIAALFPVFGVVAAFGFAPLAPDAALIPVHQVEMILPAVALAAQVQSLDLAHTVYRREERISRSDTLGTVLTRLGVDDRAAEDFMRGNSAARVLYALRPGRHIAVDVDERGRLLSLRYQYADSNADQPLAAGTADSLLVEHRGDTFSAREIHEANERSVALTSGEITTSLYGSTDAAGIPDAIANQIAEIFAGEIDFYRDLRRGDRFRVVYENFRHDGETAHAGRVLAVEFVTSSRSHQAVWYQAPGQPGSYYGFDGHSMRRAFLRAPLQFSRISSGFGGRVHPILNLWKWHTGIDYAAPIGTPVRATSDGVVKFVGQQTGYGNAIELKHQGLYSTLYGHLSRFAPGVRAGQNVSQGQVIGYVGMTGWATGPHLHYEFRISGVAKDPLHVAMPDASPIGHEQLAAFHHGIAPFDHAIARLRSIDQSVAVGEANPPRA